MKNLGKFILLTLILFISTALFTVGYLEYKNIGYNNCFQYDFIVTGPITEDEYTSFSSLGIVKGVFETRPLYVMNNNKAAEIFKVTYYNNETETLLPYSEEIIYHEDEKKIIYSGIDYITASSLNVKIGDTLLLVYDEALTIPIKVDTIFYSAGELTRSVWTRSEEFKNVVEGKKYNYTKVFIKANENLPILKEKLEKYINEVNSELNLYSNDDLVNNAKSNFKSTLVYVVVAIIFSLIGYLYLTNIISKKLIILSFIICNLSILLLKLDYLFKSTYYVILLIQFVIILLKLLLKHRTELIHMQKTS